MREFFKYRCVKSGFRGTIFLYVLMEWLAYIAMYYGVYLGLLGILVAYILLPYILPNNTNKESISFHIHRGLFIVITDIYNRQKGIFYFYLIVFVLIFAMTLYLIKVSPLIGLFMVILISICKFIIYYLLHSFSKQLGSYPEFTLK